MKLLTKEEEEAHYNATVKGGILGGIVGCAVGSAGVLLATRRSHVFRGLTVPFRAFLVASTGTFGAIIQADRASRRFDAITNPYKQKWDQELAEREQESHAGKSQWQLTKEWAEEHRYSIVFGSWVASMGASGAIVSRNKYLTGAQKLVQARVYAQGLTLAVLLASFAFEANDANKGKGRWETVKVLDPNDPQHKRMIEKRIHHERYAGEDLWREMVDAEEAKIKARKEAAKAEVQKASS